MIYRHILKLRQEKISFLSFQQSKIDLNCELRNDQNRKMSKEYLEKNMY